MESKQYVRECPEGLRKIYAFWGNRKAVWIGTGVVGLLMLAINLLCSNVFGLRNDWSGTLSTFPLLPPVIYWYWQDDKIYKIKRQLRKEENISPKTHLVEHKYDPVENKLIFTVKQRQ